jgi:uncharacterized protein
MNEQMPSHDSPDRARPAPYWNPYLAGVLLGAALLASFLVLGAGLGASAAAGRVGACVSEAIAPEYTRGSGYFGPMTADGGNPLRYYLVYMFIGTFLGGLLSAVLANRIRPMIERGPKIGAGTRVGFALIGGLLVGYASMLAKGCTSGQALTGGALLLNGSIIFMGCVFGGGYAVAYFARKLWIGEETK